MPTEFLGVDPQRLLSANLENRLLRSIGRGGGFMLLALVAGIWMSLLTWSVADPSLTHATGGSTQNWMGPLGAIVSDLMLQLLGVASLAALLAPMFWGFELTTASRVLTFRAKLAFYPISVLLLAGACSALPLSGSWPLHHGMGGILGDVLYRIGTSIFGLINPERAGLAAGILFLITGASAMLQSLGLLARDLLILLTPTFTNWSEREGSWHQNLRAEAHRLRERLHTPAAHAVMPTTSAPRTTDANWRSERTEPALGPIPHQAPARTEPVFELHGAYQEPPTLNTGAAAPWGESGARQDSDSYEDTGPAFAPTENMIDYGEDDDLLAIDPSSRAMAARFAPRGAKSSAAVPREIPTPPAPEKKGLLRHLNFRQAEPGYKRPSLNLLKRAPGSKSGSEFTQAAMRGSARLLEDVLADFGVKGEVKDIKPGPVVTLFELEPARGTKSSRVIALSEDIARSMSAVSVRVAVVPGRNAIGIELPNVRRETVLLREILESDAFRTSEAALPMALGKSIGGEPVVADLARMPHLLVAGTTGSGKSVGVNAMILSLLYRHSPEDCRFLMIDPKMLELSVYNGIPHLLAPVITDPHKAVTALNWVVNEMEERYKRMSKLSVRNIDVFNNRVRNAKKRGEMIARTVQTGYDRRTDLAVYESQEIDLEPMPYIVVVVDEFADLMIVAGKEIEAAVQRLAQMARAAGIHLIMATQRPSVDVITGTIKANFPTRISFKVASKIDSRTILNDQGAEQLLGQGDMLYSAGSGQIVRVHGPFVADDEVENIAAALREHGEPRYVAEVLEPPAGQASGDLSGPRETSDDDLYDRAVAIVVRDQKASTSYIQRRLSIGYNRAADLVERMEREGLISPANHTGKREILAGQRATRAAG